MSAYNNLHLHSSPHPELLTVAKHEAELVSSKLGEADTNSLVDSITNLLSGMHCKCNWIAPKLSKSDVQPWALNGLDQVSTK